MEALVGRAVSKAFPGFGTYGGVVESYDADAGYFRVLYEDGDSEEVDADEMAEILVGPAMPQALQQTPPRDAAGRRPKKRRRGDEESPSSTTPPGDGVVLAVPAGGGSSDGEVEPATRAEASGEAVAAEKKRRASPLPESSRLLRRSARQAKAAERAAEMEAAAAVAAAAEAAEAEAAAASTPPQSGRKRPRANGSGRFRSVSRDLEDAVVKKPPPKPVLSLKPELPPSSQGLDLGDLPVLDVFQVYSCLRSFSRQLFLSPFPLDTFVAALQCTLVNPLIDWVHFALLRSLKSHLEDFANEGDPSAVHCIRNLNWELLDLATWPIYLAEYLLTRGTELRYSMKLTDLKLLSTEYYRQPAVVKLELLRSLSDDVLETGAIRSRMSELDGNDEGFRNTGLRRKKRGSSAKGAADSSQSPEGSDEMDDGNSDECYLCGMDGNLLCCDGCPAAFHSKCVGVVEDLLPEGDWYCPECLIQKNDGSKNMANPMRGAEVLGIDPHGRLYFGTCGYLLVIDSCEGNPPCHYYGHVDLHSLVTVLKTCHPSYRSIVNAISSFCGTATESPNLNGRYQSSRECSTSDAETNCRLSSRLKQRSEYDQFKVEQDNSFEQLDSGKACTSNSDQLDQDLSLQSITFRSALMPRSGNAAEGDSNQIPQNRSSSAKNDHCNSQEGVYSHANGLSAENEKDSAPKKKQSDWHLHSDLARYINYYSFGQIAASAAEELKHKLSENKEGKKPVQDALLFHLRTICKKYANVFALTDQKLSVELLKEKCGWCNSCQISGGVDCIFRVTDIKCMEGPKPHTFGLGTEKNMESHIILAMHNILSIEERLNGLLTGPWQNPQYSICWRKAVLKASDVSSLKQPLLMLESSLRRVAISVEWQKPADSVEVVGSAAHILVRSSNKSLSNGSARKPGRKPSSNGELKVDSRDVGVYWWRGGKLSCQVFHWKRLPQSLVYKAARQAGRRKIPTILYTDGSQFARRFKYIAWRAAVEMAENVAQLILQIKELEWNIKWTEILSTLPSSLMTKETQKIARLFKKVIIRRKRIEGTNVEYLLDFGKRENIPPVISKHGTKFEEPSSERNRYWLREGHVPLNLLKAYEAKAFARLLKKKETGELPKKTKKMRDSKPKMPKKTGFAYLFERAEKQSTGLCGHCNKEVVARGDPSPYASQQDQNGQSLEFKTVQSNSVTKNEQKAQNLRAQKGSKTTAEQQLGRNANSHTLSFQMEPEHTRIFRDASDLLCEAVNCQYCAALFHRKHFKVPRGAADAVYVCNKCLAEKVLKVKSPQKKASPKKSSPKKKQKKQKKQSHKIVTRRNQVVLKYKKKTGKKGKRGRPRKNPLDLSKNELPKMRESEPSNVPKNEPVKRISKRLYDKYMKGNSNVSEHAASRRKRKRTALQYSYWLNGLRWTQNPHDERARSFRKERVAFPSEDTEMSEVSPVCCLCEKCYSEEDIYIACEKCEDWFHGDIYSVTIENVNNLIGFKCHRCRLRSLPVCPYAQTVRILKGQSDEDHDIVEDEEHSIDKFVEDEDPNCPNDLGTHGSQKDLHDHSNLKEVDIERRLNGHITEKELSDNNCLEELNDHSNLKDIDTHSTEKELDDTKSLKELDAHNELKELDSPGSEEEPGDHNRPKELNNNINLKDLDICRTDKELNNHNCLNELDGNYNWKGLDDHNSQEELDGTASSKFAVEETQCPMELGGFNSLKLDNHNNLEELNNHNCPKESDNKNSSKELDSNRNPKDSGDFLAEHFNNIRISGNEELIVTPETGSVKEPLALQSKDDSEKTAPAEHEINLQVVVTL